jgi:hypothetical protein
MHENLKLYSFREAGRSLGWKPAWREAGGREPERPEGGKEGGQEILKAACQEAGGQEAWRHEVRRQEFRCRTISGKTLAGIPLERDACEPFTLLNFQKNHRAGCFRMAANLFLTRAPRSPGIRGNSCKTASRC